MNMQKPDIDRYELDIVRDEKREREAIYTLEDHENCIIVGSEDVLPLLEERSRSFTNIIDKKLGDLGFEIYF